MRRVSALLRVRNSECVRSFRPILNINKHVFSTSKLHDQIETCLNEYAENNAIIYNEHEITYKELHDSVFKLSYMLSNEYGIGEGDKLLMISDTRFDSFQTPIACCKLGVAFISINPYLANLYLDSIYKLIQPNITICESKYFYLLSQFNINPKNIIISDDNNIQNLLGSDYSITQSIRNQDKYCKNRDDDIYQIMFTSGTTGIPKGCVLTHSVVYNMINIKELNLPIDRNVDKLLITNPIFGSTATGVTLTALKQGIPCIIPHSLNTKLDIDEVYKLCNLHKITGVLLFGQQLSEILKYCLENNVKFETLKWVFFGGDFIPFYTLYSIWSKKLIPNAMYMHMYGTAESSTIAMLNPMEFERICNEYDANDDEQFVKLPVGTAIDGTQIKIINANKSGVGEIIVHNNHTMTEYYKQKEKTQQVIDENGWYHTGDLGYFDDDDNDGHGLLFINGRIKDIIIDSDGTNIYPIDIERIFSKNQCIAEIAVVGYPNILFDKTLSGEIPVAFVSVKNEYKNKLNMVEKELMKINDKLSYLHRVHKIFFVDVIEESLLGKMAKNVLKDKIMNGQFKIDKVLKNE